MHQQWEAVAAANRVDRLAFDASPEGERLRRFQLAGNRSLLRTLETLLKIRREGDDPQPDPDATDATNPPAEDAPPASRRPRRGPPTPPRRVGGLRPRRNGRPKVSCAPGSDPARDGALPSRVHPQPGWTPGGRTSPRAIDPPRHRPVPAGGGTGRESLPRFAHGPASVRRGSPDPAVGPTEGLPIASEGLVGPRPAVGAIASGVRPSVRHSGGVRRPAPNIPSGKSGTDSRPIPGTVDLPISRNEPTTGPGQDIPVEPAPADDRRDSRNEPTADRTIDQIRGTNPRSRSRTAMPPVTRRAAIGKTHATGRSAPRGPGPHRPSMTRSSRAQPPERTARLLAADGMTHPSDDATRTRAVDGRGVASHGTAPGTGPPSREPPRPSF